MTLLVIRDAEQAVKQLNVPKLLVISVPLAAVLSISGLIVSMQWKAAAHIKQLEKQVAQQAMSLEITVKDKNAAISRLQHEVVRLSSQTQTMKKRVGQINSMEKQLQQFIEDHIEPALPAPMNMSSKPATIAYQPAWNAQQQVGGEEHAWTTEQIIALSQRSQLDLEQIRDMLITIQKSTPSTLQQAEKKQLLLAGTPNYWPTPSRRMTSSFGYRQDPISGRAAFHAGLDIGGQLGDPIYAAADGRIIEAEFNSARGRYIIIRHVNGIETWYMHLHDIHVAVNQTVKKGDIIGELGSTGRSTGPHLHFQVMQRGDAVNPLPYLKRRTRVVDTAAAKDATTRDAATEDTTEDTTKDTATKRIRDRY
ncbi:peptidoglycan DD-metalloendopeptidase family protein [Paenibacillus sp. 481]|nr:peptidoglycan DD-metalloendopeptidase family protein [Paenibacillus sp. 481]